MSKKKNLPKYVLYESRLVGRKGLPFAIKDAQHLHVPLAIHKCDEKIVLGYLYRNDLSFDIDIILI